MVVAARTVQTSNGLQGGTASPSMPRGCAVMSSNSPHLVMCSSSSSSNVQPNSPRSSLRAPPRTHSPSLIVRRVSQPNPARALVLESNTLAEQLQAHAASLDAFRNEFSANLEARLMREIEERLQAFEVRMSEKMLVLEEGFCLSAIKKDAPSVEEISDQVITRVLEDSQIYKVGQNHDSLQESFSKLMEMLDEAPLGVDQKLRNERHNSGKLREMSEMILETQARCDKADLALRLVHEQRSQDNGTIALLMQALEKKFNDIDAGIFDRRSGLVKSFEGKLEARSKEHLEPVEEEKTREEEEDETDGEPETLAQASGAEFSC